MPVVYLIEGTVGAGRSTYARALAQRTQGVHIALDEWFAVLFSPDRPPSDFIPWYTQRKDRLAKGAAFAMVVPDPIFEIASKPWEPPDEAECEVFAVTFVGTEAASPLAG